MAVNISNYLFKKTLRVTASSISTDEIYGSLTLFNNLVFTNGQQTTDVTSSGVVIAQLDYGKTASFTGESPVVNDTILGLQTGTIVEQVTNISDVAIQEVLTVTGNTCVAKYAASGNAGSEIKFAYLIDAQGAPQKTFTQGTVADVGVFSYDASTKTLTFNTGEVPAGSRVLIKTYPVISQAKLVTNDVNAFSYAAKIDIDLIVADVCDPSKEFLGHIVFPTGKFSGEFEWNIDGTTPSVQSFTVTSLMGCNTTSLWDFYIYDEADILTTVNP